MDGLNRQSAYRKAFEHAKARLVQLIGELESLENRHSALLTASKALQSIIARPADQQSPDQNVSAESNRAPTALDQDENWQWKRPVTKTYVHDGTSANEIERRIDLAIGR